MYIVLYDASDAGKCTMFCMMLLMQEMYIVLYDASDAGKCTLYFGFLSVGREYNYGSAVWLQSLRKPAGSWTGTGNSRQRSKTQTITHVCDDLI